ncbi:MAG: hypothetical protein IT237_04330 [Bacteroidia bacterium]|nr:hypothetical protein [Bacteroidia bacterium]
MLEQIEKIVTDGIGEIIAVAVTIGIAAIKRALEKRKLRRKGILRDKRYFEDNKDIKNMYH